MTVKFAGLEFDAPEKMSFTITVPAAVPSLFQSSVPLVPSLALKNSVPPKFVSEEGELLVRGPGIFRGYWGREAATADAIRDG